MAAEPREARTRHPAVAGSFYPDGAGECLAQVRSFLAAPSAPQNNLTAPPRGALVPHAGWICSGAIAGQAIAALAHHHPAPDVVVIFGAVHTPLRTDVAALDSHERWHLPSADSEIATALRQMLAEDPSGLFRVDDRFHLHEHAVEVEVPLIQAAWPSTPILPIEVPLSERAVEIGAETARISSRNSLDALFLASSDLTHYGPNYRFVPAGIGLEALSWAKDNDRRLLDLARTLSADQVVPEVQSHWNACGGGAIAAMLAACRELGASSADLLCHANSYETLAAVARQSPDNAVGYAAMVVG